MTRYEKNHETSKKLGAMWNDLTEKARDVIDNTDFNIIDELFSGLETAEEVNKFIKEEFEN